MAANDFFVKTDGSQQKSQQIAKFANECANILSKKKGVPIYVIEVHALKCRWRIPTTKNFISAKDSTDSTDSTDLKIKKFI